MSEHPLALFIAFVENDRHIREMLHHILEQEKQIVSLQQEQDVIRQSVAEADQALRNAHKEVRQQESLMDTLEGRAKVVKKKLEETNFVKEFSALTKEVETIGHAQHVQETNVLNAWRALEKAERTQVMLKNESMSKQSNLAEQINNNQSIVQKVRHDYNERIAQREKLAHEVQKEWLEKYNRMLESVPDPVVPVINSMCSACSYSMTVHDMMRLERNALLECKGCFRFLFLPEKLHRTMQSKGSSLFS